MELGIAIPVMPQIVFRGGALRIKFHQPRNLIGCKAHIAESQKTAFYNIPEMQHIVYVIHGETNNFIAAAGNTAQNTVVTKRKQRFANRRFTAAVSFHEILFVENLLRFIFMRKNILQNGAGHSVL